MKKLKKGNYVNQMNDVYHLLFTGITIQCKCDISLDRLEKNYKIH